MAFKYYNNEFWYKRAVEDCTYLKCLKNELNDNIGDYKVNGVNCHRAIERAYNAYCSQFSDKYGVEYEIFSIAEDLRKPGASWDIGEGRLEYFCDEAGILDKFNHIGDDTYSMEEVMDEAAEILGVEIY